MKPEHRGNEALGLIRGGLRDFSISRTSIQWGIPLPWDPAHVTYVWFDALTNYLAAVGFGDGTGSEGNGGYEDWWPVDYHLIGKDIVRQHCVYWPAMLMSAGIEPPKGWAIGGWLLSGGEKMSKTSGNVVNPLDLIDDVGLDGFRYYVLADTAYGNDGDFTYEGLVTRYNSDLANNLGNLLARVATVVGKKCDGVGPRADPVEPARGRRGERLHRHRRRVGHRPTEPCPRRHVAAHPGDQRPPRGERTVEGRARPGRRRRDGRRARGAADRGDPRAAGDARHRPGGVGTHRPDRTASSTNASPPPRHGAGTPAASPSPRATPCSPA